MIPELDLLWRAQELDRALLLVREKLARLPSRRKAIDDSLAGARAALVAAEERSKSQALTKRNAEKDAEALGEQEKRFQVQLTQVKKNEEYAALLHEIEAAKKKRSDLETFVLERMEDEAQAGLAIKAAKDALAQAERGAAGERAQVDGSETTLRTEETELFTKREDILAGLRPAMKLRYERILSARSGRAVVELVRDSCAGCGAHLPAQSAIEVRKGAAVVESPDCGRILIHRPEAEATV